VEGLLGRVVVVFLGRLCALCVVMAKCESFLSRFDHGPCNARYDAVCCNARYTNV
jgi:hypothetical protein